MLGGPPDANDKFEGYVEDNEMVQMMAQKDSGVILRLYLVQYLPTYS